MTASQVVADNRGRLFAIAYRMLGEIGEAEDAVQEAFVRWERNDGPVDNPEAWLTTVAPAPTGLHLRDARTQRGVGLHPPPHRRLDRQRMDPAHPRWRVAGIDALRNPAKLVSLD